MEAREALTLSQVYPNTSKMLSSLSLNILTPEPQGCRYFGRLSKSFCDVGLDSVLLRRRLVITCEGCTFIQAYHNFHLCFYAKTEQTQQQREGN